MNRSAAHAQTARRVTDENRRIIMSITKRFHRGQIVKLDGKPARVADLSPGGNYVHLVPITENTRAIGGTAQELVYAMALSESQARKRVLAPGEDPALVTLTIKQRELLESVRATGGRFLEGAEVRNARALVRLELVTLEDYGSMRVDLGTRRTDGERWWCKPIGAKP